MRFSKSLITTYKEAPKEAALKSHEYLLRGGFIFQVSAGIYDYLPLGKITLDKIKNIIKEELDIAGCEEVSLGFVTPASFWKQSHRYEKYGKELLRFKDRHDNEFVLGPTHEEMMVELVKNRVKSYKQLPLNLYQINLKFRDEARPRFGLMRGREFLMKDGYSFHKDKEDMIREFNLMEETYKKIFTRLGLDFRVVEADSGAIGGSGSKEFMVLADSGEDTIVLCSKCEYAANIEAAKRKPKHIPINQDDEDEDDDEWGDLDDLGEEFMDYEEIYTPGITTIDELSDFFGFEADRFVKAVAKKAIYDDKDEVVVFFIRGDDELEETKALNAIGANEFEELSDEDMKNSGIVAGFIGPKNITVKYMVDEELRDAEDLIIGGNKKDYHIQGYCIDLEDEYFADLIKVKEGDLCPKCHSPLKYSKGIEVGHIFQLNDRYSKPLKAEFLDEDGKAKPFVMGTYGIGVSRLMAAIIEQHHDEKGMIWTKSTAPYNVVIVTANIKDEEQMSLSKKIYEELQSKNISVIWDDRKERLGFKMKDFELLGFNYAIIVGKNAKDDTVELISRATLQKEVLNSSELIKKLENL